MTDPDKFPPEPEGAEDAEDAAYIAEHGSDDLDVGHLRDPKGDEQAHA